MRKRWIASFALSLGFLTATARAGDDPWHQPALKPTAQAAPAATLGRPVAIDDATPSPLPPLVDNQVRRTAYDGSSPPALTDSGSPRPLPVGTPSPSGNQHTWTRDDTTAPPTPSTSIGKPISSDDGSLPAPRTDTPSGYGSQLWARFTGGCGDDCGCTGGDCGGDCGGNCFGGCCPDGCCYNSGNRWYVSAEALLWWMKGDRTPPLATTGSAADAVPGALGQPGTQVLFGGSQLSSSADAGGRFQLGYWFTRDHSLGFEADYWFLGTKSNDFSASSTGNPLLFRPFTDETGAQNVELVAVPSPTGPGLNGTVTVLHKTSLWGTDANFRANLLCGSNWFIDCLYGFRAMGLDDNLGITENLNLARGVTINGTPFPTGTTFLVNDSFNTQNRFYGGQIGLDMECKTGNWIFDAKPMVALGATNQIVNINGGTTITVPGVGTTSYSGGLLAQNSNIGHYNRNAFTAVPELGVSVGYQVNDHWRLSLGYNLIYWSSVVRAGEQINTTVNRNQIPPPISTASQPAFAFQSTSFWAQGLMFSIEYKW